jgi:hypothetical protein
MHKLSPTIHWLTGLPLFRDIFTCSWRRCSKPLSFVVCAPSIVAISTGTGGFVRVIKVQVVIVMFPKCGRKCALTLGARGVLVRCSYIRSNHGPSLQTPNRWPSFDSTDLRILATFSGSSFCYRDVDLYDVYLDLSVGSLLVRCSRVF